MVIAIQVVYLSGDKIDARMNSLQEAKKAFERNSSMQSVRFLFAFTFCLPPSIYVFIGQSLEGCWYEVLLSGKQMVNAGRGWLANAKIVTGFFFEIAQAWEFHFLQMVIFIVSLPRFRSFIVFPAFTHSLFGNLLSTQQYNDNVEQQLHV